MSVAGWGWCQGANVKGEAKLAQAQLTKFGLRDYVADIEHGVNNASWTAAEVVQFLTDVRQGVAGTLAYLRFG